MLAQAMGWSNPLLDGIARNRQGLINFGAGLAGGRNIQDGIAQGLAGLAQGRGADQAEALRQAQIQQQTEERNRTMEWLQQNQPDLAGMVASGMPIGEAWGQALQRMQAQAQPPEMTANQRDFMFAQENPEFNQFLNGSRAPQPTAGIQEYEYAKSQGYQGTFQEFQQSKRPTPAMNATVQKEIFEADEAAQSGEAVMQALDRAMELNKTAWDGPYAEQRAYGQSFVPDWVPGIGGNSAEEANTLELKNLVTAQALDQLRATFGAMPTEGERKILLEIQGSVDQPREVRRRIFERAKQAAARRIEANRRKAESLRSGTYFDPGFGPGGDGWTVLGVE